jgi:hypothetical protein
MLRHKPTGLYLSKSGRIHKLSKDGMVYTIPIQMKWYFNNPDDWILVKYKNTDETWIKVYGRDFEIAKFEGRYIA